MKKRALITGITGQDGSYLAEFLLEQGYEVHGLVRRVALEDPANRQKRINHISSGIKLHPGSLENHGSTLNVVDEVRPNELFHLGAQSFVAESFEDGFSTLNINIFGTLHVLSAVHKRTPDCKVYFAGSSEMFGLADCSPQDENTGFKPRSPYGISKVNGFDLTRNYREAYKLFACCGILFNHESPRRGREFVTRKITSGVARIKKGESNILVLGNLDAKRDWGFAGDYVRAMWLMLQQEEPDDYVVATGQNHTIKDFLDAAFIHAGLTYELVDLHDLTESQADGKIEELKMRREIFVVQHPSFYRPAEVNDLLGDASKAKRVLGWRPEVAFDKLVTMMMEEDLKK